MSALNIQGVQRLQGLGVAFGLLTVFAVLRLAGATQAQISAATADPQAYVTAAGADEFVLVLATAIGWLLLGWVLLGAVLVLGSAVPGWIGWLFNSLARLLLPATLRRFVSLALGVTLLSGTSVASAAPPVPMAAISVTVDWPAQQEPEIAAVPDWPPAPSGGPDSLPEPAPPPAVSPEPALTSAGTYLVQAGDCLWDIAERTLAQASRPINAGSVAAAVAAWFQFNSDQIQDPDLIYPGQALTPPTLQP